MKGIVVFSDANDVTFLYADYDYKLHLNKKALETGLIEEKALHKDVDPNVVVQLFMPLVASSRFMVAQVKNPYFCITLDNGFTFVFEYFGSLLLIGINGDGEEDETFLRRKLLVLKKIIQFHFGPVIESLRPSITFERRQTWKLFSRLIETWCKLVKTEQSFLVEAVERLHVSQPLNAKCVDLLEAVLSQVRSGGDKYALHAALTVGTKLLALYSSRNACELQPEDTLLLILVGKEFFPHEENIEDLFSKSYAVLPEIEPLASWPIKRPGSLGSDITQAGQSVDGFESARDGDNSSDEQYFSPRTTPIFPRKSGCVHDPSIITSTPIKEEYYSTAEEDEDGITAEFFISPKPTSLLPDDALSLFPEESDIVVENEAHQHLADRESDFEDSNDSEQDSDIRSDYQHKTVFLHTPLCVFTPHTLHSLQIVPGLVLTVISEVPRGNLSGIICQTLNTLKAVLVRKTRAESASLIVDQLDSNIRRLLDATRKAKQPAVDKLMRDAMKRWELVKNNGLQMFLELPNKGEITPKLENSICSMYEKLKNLFEYLYMRQQEEYSMYKYSSELVGYVRACLQRDLQDYSSYLTVKAQRNITMTTYLEEFPGLVHFIHVNRHSHQMTAPSINVVQSSADLDGKRDITQVLKDKIWDIVQRFQSKLAQGYTCVTMREGDFLYTYQLWFEDSAGNHKMVQQPFHTSSTSEVPGILTGRFFSNICRQCFQNEPRGSVHCYELICVHIGVVPTEYVQAHCKRLAALIWETSGEAHTPISLL